MTDHAHHILPPRKPRYASMGIVGRSKSSVSSLTLLAGVLFLSSATPQRACASYLENNVALSSLGAQAFDNGNWVEEAEPGAGWEYDASLAIDDNTEGGSLWFGVEANSYQQMWVVFDKPYSIDAVYIDEFTDAYSTSAQLEYRRGESWFPITSISKSEPDYLFEFPAQLADAVRLTIDTVAAPGGWYNYVAGVYSLEVRGGPGTIECGDGIEQAGEECDDGDTAEFEPGDFCTAACALVPCGQPTNPENAEPKANDALFVLKAAIGSATCDMRVCDVNGNSQISTTDALFVLRKVVGIDVTLNCPV